MNNNSNKTEIFFNIRGFYACNIKYILSASPCHIIERLIKNIITVVIITNIIINITLPTVIGIETTSTATASISNKTMVFNDDQSEDYPHQDFYNDDIHEKLFSRVDGYHHQPQQHPQQEHLIRRILSLTEIAECTSKTCAKPIIVSNSMGNFLIAWIDYNYNVYARVYNMNGDFLCDTINVNSIRAFGYSISAFALNNNNFVIVWAHYSYKNIYGRIIGESGSPVTNQFNIAVNLNLISSVNVIGINSQFIVIWTGIQTNATSDYYIYYNTFDIYTGQTIRGINTPIDGSAGVNTLIISSIDSKNYALAFTTFASNVPINVITIDVGSITTTGGSIASSTCSINLIPPDKNSFSFVVSTSNFVFLWPNSLQTSTQINIVQGCSTATVIYTKNLNQIVSSQSLAIINIQYQNQFVIAWSVDSSNIFVQYFQSTGQALNSNIQVNTPSLAMNLSMNFLSIGNTVIIVWSATNVYGQIIQANGTVRGFINCNPGQYESNAGTLQATCQSCSSGCQYCTNATWCTQCYTGTFLSTQGSQVACVYTCPSGTGPDPTASFCQTCASNTYSLNGNCMNCDSSCATCSGPASNQCLSCSSSTQVLNAGSCYDCSSGTYFNSGACSSCDPSCATCSGPASNECLSCSSNTQVLNAGSCHDCSSGTYFNSEPCSLCDPSCATCSGPAANECLSCSSSTQVLNAGSCHDCSPGTYFNSGACYPCSSSCATCLDSSQCLSCPSNQILNSGVCESCPSGNYYSSVGCLPCSPTCATCLGPASNQCLSCPSNQVLAITGSCETCPSGTIYNNGVCLPCSSTCATCSGPSANQCLTCPSNQVLISGTCQECTSSSYYSNGACIPCDPTCATCSGSGSNQCLTCSSSEVLVQTTCQNSLAMISASLAITSDPSRVNLKLQPRAQSLINILNTSISLTINYGDYTNYTYNLSDTGETTITIIFSFSSYLPPGGILSLNFTVDYVFDTQARVAYTISPMELTAILLEYYPYSASEVSVIQSSQQAVSTATTASQVSAEVIAVTSSTSSTAFTVVQCIDLFSMVRYLDIVFPPNAMSLFSQLKVQPVSLTFLPNIFSLIPIEQVDLDFLAPLNFSFYNVKLFILDNFGGQLYQFSIMITTAILFLVMSILPIKLPLTIGNILLKIQNILVWNFILSFLISNYFSGVMFIFIQLYNMPKTTSYQLANAIVCSICIGYLAFPFITFWITLKHYKALCNNSEQAPLPKYGSLLQDYRHDNIIQIMHATIYLIRGFFAFSILVWKMDSPLVIVITWIVLCIGILAMLIIFKPYIKKKSNLLTIGCEGFNLAIYSVVLNLIFTEVTDIDTRNSLGFVILYLNTALYVWISLFSIYDLVIMAVDIIKQLQKARAEKAKMKYQYNLEPVDNNLSYSNVRFNISKCLNSKQQDDTLPNQESRNTNLDLSIAIGLQENPLELTDYISSIDDPRLKHLTRKLKLKKFDKDQQNSSLSAAILYKSSAIKSLDLFLENEGIKDNDLAALSASLIACKNLTELIINLSHNMISDDGIIHIFTSLRCLNTMSVLNIDLGYNHIGNNGIDAMAKALSNMTKLTDLRINLNNNPGKLKSNTLKKLSNALEDQKHMEKLHLKLDSLNLANKITSLVEILPKLKLTNFHLSISNNNISPDDLLNICKSYLSKLTKLESFGLELNSNLLTSLEFQALGSLIKSYKDLKELKLSLINTNITPKIMTNLAMDISKNQAIMNITLDLSENNFSLMGIEHLQDSINIESLSLILTNCGIKTENLNVLFQIISGIPNLKTINLVLTKNNIDDNGRALLKDWLSQKIQIVNISVAF